MSLIEASSFRFSRLIALTMLNQTADHNYLIDTSSLGPLSLSALTMHPEQSRRQQDHGATLMPCGNSDIDMRQHSADSQHDLEGDSSQEHQASFAQSFVRICERGL